MTLAQIDNSLAEWRGIVDSAAQRLVELHSLPSYEFLVGPAGSPKPRLTGATEERVRPAIHAVEIVLEQFGTLSDTIQRATALRAQLSRFPGWGSEAKIREIEHLLRYPSIPISSASTNPTATAARISPRQLLGAMNEQFQVAHNTLLEIDRIWKALDQKLSAAMSFTAKHSQEPSVSTLRSRIDALRTRVIQDPIGSNLEFDQEIEPLLRQVHAALERLISQRANLRESLAHGRILLRRLLDLRQEAEGAFAECKEKICGHPSPTPPLPPDRIAALYEWLTRLEAKFAEGVVDPVCVGLDNWMGHVTELIAVEERTCMENRLPVELRRELRGRLSALRAKATARGVSNNDHLLQIAQRADSLLHSRPTPMKEVKGLIALYESQLNAAR